MPRGDGTGPEGRGSMTGRGAGRCSGSNRPGYQSNLPRRGGGGTFGNGLRRLFGGRNRNNDNTQKK